MSEPVKGSLGDAVVQGIRQYRKYCDDYEMAVDLERKTAIINTLALTWMVAPYTIRNLWRHWEGKIDGES